MSKLSDDYAKALKTQDEAGNILKNPAGHSAEALAKAEKDQAEAKTYIDSFKHVDILEKLSQGGDYRIAIQTLATIAGVEAGNSEGLQALLGITAGYLITDSQSLLNGANDLTGNKNQADLLVQIIRASVIQGLAGDTGHFAYPLADPNQQPPKSPDKGNK